MYSFQDDFGFPVTLTFDESVYVKRQAKHVLVFAFYEQKLLCTVNTERGIELPGGKIEPNETSIAAAIRETYEETGYALSAIKKIGQYTVNETLVKDIYVATVEQFVTEMLGGSVGGSMLLEEIPATLKDRPEFSRYLYDDVYPLTLQYIREHHLLPL